MRKMLDDEEYEVDETEKGEEALEALSGQKIDLIHLDIKMKGMDGIETLERIKELGYETPVILVSGHGTIEIAVEATKKGAYDFLEKPPDLNRLLVSIRNALQNSKLRRANRQMRSRLHGVQEIIGQSRQIEQIKETIRKIAP